MALAVTGNLDDLHHAELLVVRHVAIQHVLPREIEKPRTECHVAAMWYDHGVEPNRLCDRFAIDLSELERIDLNSEVNRSGKFTVALPLATPSQEEIRS